MVATRALLVVVFCACMWPPPQTGATGDSTGTTSGSSSSVSPGDGKGGELVNRSRSSINATSASDTQRRQVNESEKARRSSDERAAVQGGGTRDSNWRGGSDGSRYKWQGGSYDPRDKGWHGGSDDDYRDKGWHGGSDDDYRHKGWHGGSDHDEDWYEGSDDDYRDKGWHGGSDDDYRDKGWHGGSVDRKDKGWYGGSVGHKG